MPPKKKNVLIITTNVGASSLELNSIEEEPFIDKAKYCIKILIEKKIFLQPKDEIGLITMGSETDNPENIDFVKLYHENLLVPNWEMVKYVNDLTSTDNPCNWIESLHVALQFVRRQVFDPECRVFLVIFNNFKEDAESIEQYDPDIILNDLKNYENLHLLFVGENPLNDKEWQENSASPSEKFVLEVMKETGSQYEQINDFIETRRFYVPPPTNSMAWKFDLEYAGLCIPCASYIKVNEISQRGTWKLQTHNKSAVSLNDANQQDTTRVVKENLTVDLHRNEISSENIINGYKFGGKYVPFSGEDEDDMKYAGTYKGIMIYGFAPQNEVKLEYWTGVGSRIITPASNEDSAAFYSLVQAMVDKQYVAIVRKVYQINCLPKMGILFPRIVDDNVWCLVHLEIPYVEDLRMVQKKPIKNLDKTLNKEKIEALDNFIDSMTISDGEPDYLNPGMFPNVRTQFEYNAIANRALNPNNALIPLDGYLKQYLEPPNNLKIKAEPHLKKLDQLFELCKFSNINKKSKKPTKVSIASSKTDMQENVEKEEIQIKDSPEETFSPANVELNMDELDEL